MNGASVLMHPGMMDAESSLLHQFPIILLGVRLLHRALLGLQQRRRQGLQQRLRQDHQELKVPCHA